VTADPSRAALITGCSSGIGRATALRLHRGGFEVYATARRPESLADLTAAGITTFPLDVTDETSMTGAVGQITAERGAVALLVNNAGYELAGLFALQHWLPGRAFDAFIRTQFPAPRQPP
jgi:NAD(P)-dependent dehydrogenase (short-subunit alcohol dehydrogenase family)